MRRRDEVSTRGDAPTRYDAAEATPARWQRLCQQAQRYDAARLRALEGALSGWPDALRVAPTPWLLALGTAREPQALSLTRAIVHEPSWGLATLRRCASAPVLSQVTTMTLAGARLGDACARVLARAMMTRLVRVDLSENALTRLGLDALLNAPKLPRQLEALSLARNPGLIGAPLGRLYRSRKVSSLLSLSLSGLAVDDAGARQLAYARVFNSLRELDLSEHALSGEGLRALSRSPYLNNLRALTLDASGEGLDAQAVRELVSGQSLGRLERLSLRDSALSEDALRALCEEARWPRLRSLDLRGSPVDAATAYALREAWRGGTPCEIMLTVRV